VLKTYQKERLTTFINPPRVCTPKDQTCYQLSKRRSRSARPENRAWRERDPDQVELPPEGDTDFMFAALAETYGFVGAAVVLSLYALLIWRTLRILAMSKNLFGTLIAGGFWRC